jgi:TatD DNase family protein
VIDSHCHLTLCGDPAAQLVDEALAVGVRRMLTVGLDEETNPLVVGLASEHGDVFAAVGRHPNSAAGFDEGARVAIEALAAHPRVAAIGETGLDYFRDTSPREDQHRAFEAQIEIAREVGKPLVIHMRDSIEDAFAVLEAKAEGVTVILHCFSGDAAQAVRAVANGWLCSFAGNVTYPRSQGLREASRVVPEDLLLVETDSPFLSPQSRRGKPNRPAAVVETAELLAAERGVSYAALEAAVEANASRFFGW